MHLLRSPLYGRWQERWRGQVITLPWAAVRHDNHRLIPAKGRRGLISSSDYRSAKQTAKLLLAAQWRGKALLGAVRLHAKVWMPDLRKRDAGNYRKFVTDSATGICYADDAQLWIETWERAGIDRQNPRIEITLSPLTPMEK